MRSDTALTSQREDAELREQFIAVLGHDLRNPLASISAGTRLIQKTKLDERAEAIVIMMQKSVMRMASLIDNVLDFARGRLGGGITLTLSAQSLEPALQQVVDELQSTHPEIDHQDRLRIDQACDCRSGTDRAAFLEPAGQRVNIRGSGEPVTVTAKTEEQFELAVCNAGNPIPADAMERLFYPFSRGEVRPSQAGLGSWPLHRLRDRQGARRHN